MPQPSGEGRRATWHVSSALVAPEAAQALANALASCPDPHDFRLPTLDDSAMKFDTPLLVLEGWISREHADLKLDCFDPLAGKVTWPPREVGQELADRFALETDLDQRVWTSPTLGEVMRSTVWDQPKTRSDEGGYRGERLVATQDFLRQMCSALGRDLVISVEISRQWSERSSRRSEEKYDYARPRHAVFLFRGDGSLQDTDARAGQAAGAGAEP